MKALKRVVDANLAGLPEGSREEVDRVLTGIARSLSASYARINNIRDALTGDIKDATENVLDASRKAERNITGVELTEAVSERVYAKMIETFNNDTNSAADKLRAGLEVVPGTSDKNYPVEKVSLERRLLAKDFEKAAEELKQIRTSGLRNLQQLKKPMKDVVEAASSQQLITVTPPFYITPDRPIVTDLPSIPSSDEEVPGDMPPDSEEAIASKKALHTAIKSAGRYGGLESLTTSGTTLGLPLTLSLRRFPGLEVVRQVEPNSARLPQG